jgi:hypothetical protein
MSFTWRSAKGLGFHGWVPLSDYLLDSINAPSANGGIGRAPFERTELSCNFLHVISYANLDNRRYRDQNPGSLRRCIFLSAKVPSLLHSPEERRDRERGSLSHCRVPPTSSRE